MQFSLHGYSTEDIMKRQGYDHKSRDQLSHEVEAAQADLNALAREFESKGHYAPPDVRASISEARELKDMLGSPQVQLRYLQQRVGVFVNLARDILRESNAKLESVKISDVGHLSEASRAARREVSSFVRDFYEEKKFDPYLQFASAEDEAAYRKREADRREAIDKAMAEGTPEGNLRALRLSKEQLLDAGAHGADRSPDYPSSLNRLEAAQGPLETQIAAASGVDKASIDAKRSALLAAAEGPSTEDEGRVSLAADLLANLRKSGITVSDSDQAGHGVKVAEAQKEKGTRLV